MTKTTTTDGMNMSGSKKRLVHSAAGKALTSVLDELDAATGDQLISELPDFLTDIIAAAKKHAGVKPAVPPLLEPVTTVEVGSYETFKARDKFREGKTTDGVKIWSLGSNFATNFLGKTERSVHSVTLRIQKLMSSSVDTPILGVLGDMAETTLAHLFELMKKQGNGQAGALLVNGWANIFYIRDQNGTLWAVDAYWRSGYGWDVVAFSVTDPVEWLADNQVVSR